MQTIDIQLYITVLCSIYILAQVFLLLLNLRHAQIQPQLPALFREFFDSETLQRANAYTRTKGFFELVLILFNGALLLVLANTSILGQLEAMVQNLFLSKLLQSILYVYLIITMLSLLRLPFQAYRTFFIEARFGFNTTTVATWCIDLAKSFILSLLIVAPILAIFFWFVETAGTGWWLYTWSAIAVFQLGVFFLYPVLIAPLFNTFTPLAEGELRTVLNELAQQLHFKTAGIFVMDGSRRSTHANAYFTGFGKNKRIVLFDTLVDTLPTAELAAVLAHEIGHEKLHHIKKSMCISLLLLGVFLWVISLLMYYEPLFLAFGFSASSPHAALVLFLLFSEPVLFFMSPVLSMLSRRHEYQADRFAVDAVYTQEPLQRALLLLSKKSLTNLNPHPWFSFFYYSHPTLFERFNAMEVYAADR